MKTEIITLNEFGVFCNERACDGCWNIKSAIRCIEIYRECMSKPFWKRKRYFQKHYGEAITKFVKDTYREIEEKSDKNSKYKKHKKRGERIIGSGEYYSGRIANDEHKAVEILDQFTKAFCIDATVEDDLVFRCKECSFSDGDKCRVKMFKCKFAPDYVDFGSMGDL